MGERSRRRAQAVSAAFSRPSKSLAHLVVGLETMACHLAARVLAGATLEAHAPKGPKKQKGHRHPRHAGNPSSSRPACVKLSTAVLSELRAERYHPENADVEHLGFFDAQMALVAVTPTARRKMRSTTACHCRADAPGRMSTPNSHALIRTSAPQKHERASVRDLGTSSPPPHNGIMTRFGPFSRRPVAAAQC